MKRVIVESPLAGDFSRNIRYARLCVLDCLRRGEAPFASHLLYTQVWDDADPREREAGMVAGHEWYDRDAVHLGAVYTDLGTSGGMKRGIAAAERAGVEWEVRTLPPDLMNRLDGEMPRATEGAL